MSLDRPALNNLDLALFLAITPYFAGSTCNPSARAGSMALLSNFGPAVRRILAHPRPLNLGSPRSDRGPGVDWRAKVDLFEQLRREQSLDSDDCGCCREVRCASSGCAPGDRQRAAAEAPLPPDQAKAGAVADFIDRCWTRLLSAPA